jgi:iron complex transport system permease protein
LKTGRYTYLLFLFLVVLLLVFIGLHLSSGATSVNGKDFFLALFSFDDGQNTQILIRELRLPRLVMALIAGSSLAVSGMLMQSLFQNPLAGPYVLGITSGSSLFVAIALLLGIPTFFNEIGIISSSILGAIIFSLLLLFLSSKIKSQVSLLLVGLMLGSFTGAIVGILQNVSNAQQLKQFVLWSMGTLQNTSFDQLPWILFVFIFSVILSISTIKPLNALVLGVRSAQHLGIELKKTRVLLIAITSLFTGLTTAFCGPIAFVGLAVPNLTKMLFGTQNHRVLLPANLLLGSFFLVMADTVIQWLEPIVLIPINAFTSLLGAPFVLFIVVKRMR